MNTQVKPLDGVLVLDLSRVLAGPWATQSLADLGARVIKIEHPERGDDTRHWGPPHLTQGELKESAYFLSANRGKESLAIDLKDPRGQDIIRRLAERADILVENFRVGGLQKYALDYESIKEINPRLVYCSITGFGQTGPKAHLPGYDFIIQAMSGLMSITGEERPYRAGVAVTDLFSGLYATIGILAAWSRAQQSGQGTHIDIALLEAQLACLANQTMNYLVSGEAPGLIGNTHPNIVPYQVFDTEDAPIVIGVGNDKQFTAMCNVMDKTQWAQDERFTSNPERVRHREILVPLISGELLKHSANYWLEKFYGCGVPAGPLNNIADAFNDEQVIARKVVQEAYRSDLGVVPTVRSPIRFKDETMMSERAPPALGDSTERILRELGLTQTVVDELRTRGIVSGQSASNNAENSSDDGSSGAK